MQYKTTHAQCRHSFLILSIRLSSPTIRRGHHSHPTVHNNPDETRPQSRLHPRLIKNTTGLHTTASRTHSSRSGRRPWRASSVRNTAAPYSPPASSYQAARLLLTAATRTPLKLPALPMLPPHRLEGGCHTRWHPSNTRLKLTSRAGCSLPHSPLSTRVPSVAPSPPRPALAIAVPARRSAGALRAAVEEKGGGGTGEQKIHPHHFVLFKFMETVCQKTVFDDEIFPFFTPFLAFCLRGCLWPEIPPSPSG